MQEKTKDVSSFFAGEKPYTQGEMYCAGFSSPGARLLSAAKFVRQGSVAADIGCDHGKLAVYLAKSGRCKKVVAADNRPLPLAKAKALVIKAGCENVVSCRLGDGLQVLNAGEAQDIIIAGMSGQTIAQIIKPVKWVYDEKMNFIFVPATRQAFLRKFLYENGFMLTDEKAVEERKRFYTIMVAKYVGVKTSKSDFFYETGLLNPTSEAAKGYFVKTAAKLTKQLCAPMSEAEKAKLMNLINEVEAWQK